MSDILQAIIEGIVEYVMTTRPDAPVRERKEHPLVRYGDEIVELLRVRLGHEAGVTEDGRPILEDVGFVRTSSGVVPVSLDQLRTLAGVPLGVLLDSLPSRDDPAPEPVRYAYHQRFGKVGVLREEQDQAEVLILDGDVMEIDYADSIPVAYRDELVEQAADDGESPEESLDSREAPVEQDEPEEGDEGAIRRFDVRSARTRWVYTSELLPIEVYEQLCKQAEKVTDLYVVASAVGLDRPIAGLDGFWKVLAAYEPQIVRDLEGRPVVWRTPDGQPIPLVEPPYALIMNEQGRLQVVPCWWLINVRTGERLNPRFLPPTFDPEDPYEPGRYPAVDQHTQPKPTVKAEAKASPKAEPARMFPDAWYWEEGPISAEDAGIEAIRFRWLDDLIERFGPGETLGVADVWFSPSVVLNEASWFGLPPDDVTVAESAGYLRFVIGMAKKAKRLTIQSATLVSVERPVYEDELGHLKFERVLDLKQDAGVEFNEAHVRYVLQQAEVQLAWLYSRYAKKARPKPAKRSRSRRAKVLVAV